MIKRSAKTEQAVAMLPRDGDFAFVQQPVGQMPWGHNLPSIEQIERELGGQ